MTVIAAIPAFNEGATIVSVIAATMPHVDEVLVVDDGSTDATAQLAQGAGATVIRHQTNQGKAAGIMTACAYATTRQADALVLLDGDGQHDPHEIPSLLQPVVHGQADLVVGSRFLAIANPIPGYRTVGLRVLNLATWIGSGQRCSDSQSGFRALAPAAFTVMSLREAFFHGLAAESELQFEVTAHQLRLWEVPIQVSYDERARRNPAKHGFGVLFRVLVLTVTYRLHLRQRDGQSVIATEAKLVTDVTPVGEAMRQ